MMERFFFRETMGRGVRVQCIRTKRKMHRCARAGWMGERKAKGVMECLISGRKSVMEME